MSPIRNSLRLTVQLSSSCACFIFSILTCQTNSSCTTSVHRRLLAADLVTAAIFTTWSILWVSTTHPTGSTNVNLDDIDQIKRSFSAFVAKTYLPVDRHSKVHSLFICRNAWFGHDRSLSIALWRNKFNPGALQSVSPRVCLITKL